ncbi:MAG TPA: ABC transporter ATP-binding protein [Thermoflexales bacterium]|nr:ABC transporter ATP-binding protein [Thermoflexales bacterium]HQW34210.1 ABC transporter ATP-binding protein [Thermoflexales bacterium]HQZ20862.1 ABC transporter ATP-binding protein [Thermoflexales bacterium]HQZ98669.1 ABC transporter ATP-binding protein [Thermoflexales bacterium]
MIRVTNLALKTNKTVLLDGLSFEVAAGEIFGVIGPDTPNKTALLRLLASLMRPTSGEVMIGGVSTTHQPEQARRLTGYLASDAGVYLDMTCAEYLAFFAECYGVSAGARPALVSDLLSLVDLQKRANTRIGALTRGMGQRLGLARALAHDPPALVLDEPMRGMDPRAQVETRELLRELAGMGKAIVLTARSLAEADGLITRGALLARTRFTAQGEMSELTSAGEAYRTILIRALGDVERVMDVARAAPGVVEIWSTGAPDAPSAPSPQPPITELRCRFNGGYLQADALLRELAHHGAQVVAFHEI